MFINMKKKLVIIDKVQKFSTLLSKVQILIKDILKNLLNYLEKCSIMIKEN